jgi:hypothetical protein
MPSKHAVGTAFFLACLAVSIWSLWWPGHTALHGTISIGCFSLLTAASLFVWRRDRKQAAASDSHQIS